MSGQLGSARPGVAERHMQYAMRRYGLRPEEVALWRQIKAKNRGFGRAAEAAELIRDRRSEEDEP